MKNTAWINVESGQIVSFRYKSSGRSVQRTVLCLDPEYLYRKIPEYTKNLEKGVMQNPEFIGSDLKRVLIDLR